MPFIRLIYAFNSIIAILNIAFNSAIPKMITALYNRNTNIIIIHITIYPRQHTHNEKGRKWSLQKIFIHYFRLLRYRYVWWYDWSFNIQISISQNSLSQGLIIAFSVTQFWYGLIFNIHSVKKIIIIISDT